MKKILTLLTALLLMGSSTNAWSFACKTAGGETIPSGGGTANVYVDLSPQMEANQNQVVDLSTQIFCHNEDPQNYIDKVSLYQGSAYNGILSTFEGQVKYDGETYPFPTLTESKQVVYDSTNDKPWPTVLYLKPAHSAGEVVVAAGSQIAVLILRQTNNYNESFNYVWNVYARNRVVVPVCGCDVSAHNVTVTLPEYPGSVPIPLTVYCAKSQKLEFYLSGTTVDPGGSIFINTASSSPALGVGIQITRNGIIVFPNPDNRVSLGTVSTSTVSLGLAANYARTHGQVTAGNVQSIIGVTFVYQ